MTVRDTDLEDLDLEILNPHPESGVQWSEAVREERPLDPAEFDAPVPTAAEVWHDLPTTPVEVVEIYRRPDQQSSGDPGADHDSVDHPADDDLAAVGRAAESTASPDHDSSGSVLATGLVDGTQRFGARRRRVRERTRARRRRRLLIAAGIVAVVGLVVGSLFSPILAVRRFEVVGARTDMNVAIARASGIPPGGAMLFVNTARAVQALQNDPQVLRAAVVRRWPSTIEIRVALRPTVAVGAVGDRRVAIGAGGVILGAADGGAGGAGGAGPAPIVVNFPEGTDLSKGTRLAAPLAAVTDMAGAIPESLRTKFGAATVSATGELSVALTGSGKAGGPDAGGTVLFGTADDASNKFQAGEAMLSGQVVLRCIDRLDLRIASDPRISRRAGC
jgi:hypothetical protein